MTPSAQRVRSHYEASIADHSALQDTVTRALDALGSPLTAEQLAPFDQFHVGGLATTAELARRLNLRSGTQVLDAGSGLGGPSRHLAQAFGCQVTGVDLSPTYVSIAELLAGRVGLQDSMHYMVGSITDLPFEAGRFDLVWTQHVVMNIADRNALYREFRRVLKPGGRLAFYDPIAAEGSPDVHYPVPWATDGTISTLLTESETRASLELAQLQVVAWEDVTAMATRLLEQQQAAPRPSLHLGMVLGPRMAEMVQNFARNLKEGRLRLTMGICVAA